MRTQQARCSPRSRRPHRRLASRRRARRSAASAETDATTWCPREAAIWVTRPPSWPVAPTTSSASPSPVRPACSSACQAVSEQQGMVAASASETPSGMGKHSSAGRVTRSAWAPTPVNGWRVIANTLVPSSRPAFGPASSTAPARSQPSTIGNDAESSASSSRAANAPSAVNTSHGPIAVAETATRTSARPGVVTGTSPTRTPEAPSYPSITTARAFTRAG